MIGSDTLGVMDANNDMKTIGDLNDRGRGAMTEHKLFRIVAICVDEVEQKKS